MIGDSHNQGIFVRIPKAASTSLENVLKNYPNIMLNSKLNILPRDDWENNWITMGLSNLWIQVIGEIRWKESFSFAFVRNPYDRAVSSWQHCCKITQKGSLIDDKSQNMPALLSYLKKKLRRQASPDISFDDFLYFLKNDMLKGEAKWHATEQYIHLINQTGDIAIDFIGKFENLQKDFNKVCEILRIKPVQLRVLNQSRLRKNYKHFYNSERKQIVEEVYKKDIELFGYSFDTNI